MRLKICGLAREEDAALAESLGAWALGFILTEKSKRHIAPKAAQDIAARRKVPAVSVFVDQMDLAETLARENVFSGLQLHGNETPEDCARLKSLFRGFVIKAASPQNPADLARLSAYNGAIDYLLIDSAAPGEHGGTGKTGDWTLAARATELGMPLILAGGLNAQNLKTAARAVPFFAADLASGTELSPGVKDPLKMRAVFSASGGEGF